MKASSPEREPGLRERKKANLKRRIADAAIALIRERGFERTTIDEIVKRVEVSQPTFYKYYPSKEAILREHGMTTFGALIQEELSRTGSVSERMRRFLRGVARQMSTDRDIWYAIAISNAYNPIREPELLTAAEAATRIVEAVIEQGRKQAEFTQAYTARRLASLLEGIVFRVCLEWGANYPVQHSLEDALDEAFDLFLRAARPQPGDKAPKKRKATR